MFDNLTPKEKAIFKKCNTPQKIQDFINTIPNNFEPDGDTCRSPRVVLATNTAHCIEGAMLAAALLAYHSYKPLLLDLTAAKRDFDHVVTPFQVNGLWGAISKTNHAVLRYREPIYKTIRELVLSYFHEYFLDDGTKTLRSYAGPFNLTNFETRDWVTTEETLWEIPNTLVELNHIPLFPRGAEKKFRKADKIERDAGKLVEWPAKLLRKS